MRFVVCWDIEWLKRRLQQKPLSRREAITYIACWLTLYALCFLLETSPDEISNSWPFIASELLLILLGTYYAWICNLGQNGQHFWSRLIAIGWVLTMRIMVFSFPLFLILALAPMEQSGMIHEIAASLLAFLFIWRLGIHFRNLNQNRQPV